MWKLHVAWFVQACVGTSLSVCVLNYREPGRNIYLTSYLCPTGEDEACPVEYSILSYVHQIASMFFGYLANLTYDVLALANALFFARQMKVRLRGTKMCDMLQFLLF